VTRSLGTEATRWLVDGMNVIGSRPDGWWRDRRAAMEDLIARLERFALRDGRSVTVVLDGEPFQRDPRAAHIEVVFAPGGPGAADDEIVRRVAADPEPAALGIVTSDRNLARRVAASGAQVVSSGSFRRDLD
jgi:predicted RNA-binding protein with PIN domain